VKCGGGDCAEPYAATAKDRDGVVFGNAPASRGVETDRQWLDETELFERQWCGVELFSGNGDAFGEGSVALYA
jgi:hypothetical protein